MAATPSTMKQLGAPLPTFELPDTRNGELVGDSYLRGRGPAVVAFICNHCPYVRAVIGRIVRDAADLKQHGVGFVAISSNDADTYPADSFPEMKLFAERNGFSFPYLHDEDQTVARSYGAACTPDFFGFNGKLELQYRGRLDESRKEAAPADVRRWLAALSDG